MQEGFTQIAQDEDDFGTQGKRYAKKREVSERVKKVWEGRQALVLWCEVVQLVLRRQVAWVVREKDVPADVEGVVRDLWALRLRNVKRLGEEGEGEGYASGSQGTTSGWSSTSEGETEGEETLGVALQRRLKKVARDRGVPKLEETLGVLYLGCLLVRAPVTIADMQDWVEVEGFPYHGVVSHMKR